MSTELLKTHTGYFIIEGAAANGWDLYRCRLELVAHDTSKVDLRAMAAADDPRRYPS